MQLPIIKAGDNIPSGCPAYIIGRDGFYLKKSTKLFDVTVKVTSIPDYEPVMEHMQWNAPLLPYSIIEEALEFFRAVYKRHKSEAVLMLAMNDSKWELAVPEQTVSGASLEYSVNKRITPVGTIHSHCDMGAFFSKTDNDDVAGFDGLHIVIGKINMAAPAMAVGVYANGRLFEFEPSSIIKNVPIQKELAGEHPWLANVKVEPIKPRLYERFPNLFDEDINNETEEDFLWNAS